MGLRVLDPRLSAEGEAIRMAPPLRAMDGAIIGLLDNGKIGTARFYDHMEDLLRSRFGVREFIRRRKPDLSRPVPPELLGALSSADAIVSGLGD
jgi:hypothetical protein